MSTYAVSELVKEVKVLLDRNQETSGLLTPTDTDTLSQDSPCKRRHRLLDGYAGDRYKEVSA